MKNNTTHHKQYIEFNDTHSLTLVSKMPQGFRMVPLLFVIYINDDAQASRQQIPNSALRVNVGQIRVKRLDGVK